MIKVAGTDASKQFDQFHNKQILEQYGPKLLKGEIGSGKAAAVAVKEEVEEPLQGLDDGEAFGFVFFT